MVEGGALEGAEMEVEAGMERRGRGPPWMGKGEK